MERFFTGGTEERVGDPENWQSAALFLIKKLVDGGKLFNDNRVARAAFMDTDALKKQPLFIMKDILGGQFEDNQLYLYQTEYEGINKLGFSQDVIKRAEKSRTKMNEAWAYKNLLWDGATNNRQTVILMEDALKDDANITLPKSDLCSEIKKKGRYLTELTKLDPESFEDEVERVEDELVIDSKGNLYEFAYTQCKDVKKWCDEIIDVIKQKKWFFWNGRNYVCIDRDHAQSWVKSPEWKAIDWREWNEVCEDEVLYKYVRLFKQPIKKEG